MEDETVAGTPDTQPLARESAAADGDLAVQLKDVTVTFTLPDGSSRTILSGLDLDIPHGQFVAIVGRSGCGKTTILNMVAGLVRQSKGQVRVLNDTPIASRQKMGFMLARDALLPWRSAARNVEYGLELRGIDKAERKHRVAKWLRAVHLTDSASLWPWQLSQGMRQRVALARTWALDPDLLLMDEPFAALDAQTRVGVQQEFLQLWQSEPGRTVLLVTHDLAEAIALADRVIIVGDGGIIDDVPVPFDRPRDLADLATKPEYQNMLGNLHHQLY